MLSSTQLRALKKGSREISRVPGDDTVNLSQSFILSKGEVEKLCLTKAENKSLITLGGVPDWHDPETFKVAFGGDLVRTNLFVTLMFNNVLFHANNVVARVEHYFLPNIARSIVTSFQVKPAGGIPFAYMFAGTQASPYTGRVTSLIVTYGDYLYSGVTISGNIYVHYQTTLTSPTATNTLYIAQWCAVPAAAWDPSKVLIGDLGSQPISRGREDLTAALQAIDASERGIPGGLIVDIPGMEVITEMTQATIPITTIPPTTKLIFRHRLETRRNMNISTYCLRQDSSQSKSS